MPRLQVIDALKQLHYSNTLMWKTRFESVEGFSKSVAGVSCANQGGRMQLTTAGANDTVSATMLLDFTSNLRELRYSQFMSFLCGLHFSAWQGSDFHLNVGLKGNNRGFGIHIVDSQILYGRVGNGTAEQTLLLEDATAGIVLGDMQVRVDFYPASRVHFFLRGVDMGSITTGLPTHELMAPAQIFNAELIDDQNDVDDMGITEFELYAKALTKF